MTDTLVIGGGSAGATRMPNIPAANTNLPAIMLGERIAARM